MKKYIKIELDISDEFIKNWNNDFLQHHCIENIVIHKVLSII